MDDNKLLENIRGKYLEARSSLFPNDKNILRGTSRTISSLAEDIFAKYVSERLGDNFEIWIDPQITMKSLRNSSGNRPLLFRPDICVVRKENLTVEMIFDLKMDLGYSRKEFVKQAKTVLEKLSLIRKDKDKAKCSLKKGKEISFNQELILRYVIFSKANISEKSYKQINQDFEGNDEVKLYWLSSGEHLNSYSEDFKIEICQTDFKNLKEELDKVK